MQKSSKTGFLLISDPLLDDFSCHCNPFSDVWCRPVLYDTVFTQTSKFRCFMPSSFGWCIIVSRHPSLDDIMLSKHPFSDVSCHPVLDDISIVPWTNFRCFLPPSLDIILIVQKTKFGCFIPPSFGCYIDCSSNQAWMFDAVLFWMMYVIFK